MKVANIYADMSSAKRLKVGCVIFDDHTRNIIAVGYNGTPPGEDNTCETPEGKTKPNVLHAEINALNKLSIINFNTIMYVTAAPCVPCALRASGIINKLYFTDPYTSLDGVRKLLENGVPVAQVTRQIIKDHWGDTEDREKVKIIKEWNTLEDFEEDNQESGEEVYQEDNQADGEKERPYHRRSIC